MTITTKSTVKHCILCDGLCMIKIFMGEDRDGRCGGGSSERCLKWSGVVGGH